MEEGAKAVYTETEVDALLTAHAALATVHQDAPALIATHAADDDAHHTKYTDAEAAAQAATLIATHAALYNLHVKEIVKSADETVNNSDTLQNDDELLFAVAANEVWAFILLPITNSSDTACFRCGMSVPSGGHLYGIISRYNHEFETSIAAFVEDAEYGVAGELGNYVEAVIQGVVVNGSTAGNVQFKWAQSTAEESDTVVKANSCILAWKLA